MDDKINESADSRKAGSIIMLSGPVGAGKTTVARQLIPLMPGQVSYIEGDKFWSFIAKDDGMEVRENFRTIMRSMTAAAIPFARTGYNVLLDFSFPPGFLKAANKIIKEIPLSFVMLLPTESVCAERVAKRPEGRIKDYSNYSYLYSLFEGEDRFIIRNDQIEPSAVANDIKEGFDAGRFLVW